MSFKSKGKSVDGFISRMGQIFGKEAEKKIKKKNTGLSGIIRRNPISSLVGSALVGGLAAKAVHISTSKRNNNGYKYDAPLHKSSGLAAVAVHGKVNPIEDRRQNKPLQKSSGFFANLKKGFDAPAVPVGGWTTIGGGIGQVIRNNPLKTAGGLAASGYVANNAIDSGARHG